MMTDGCLLAWVSDREALSYSHLPLSGGGSGLSPHPPLVSLFHRPNVDGELLSDGRLMTCQVAVRRQQALFFFH